MGKRAQKGTTRGSSPAGIDAALEMFIPQVLERVRCDRMEAKGVLPSRKR